MTGASRRRIRDALRILCDETITLGRFRALAHWAQSSMIELGGGEEQILDSIFQSSWRSLVIGLAGMLSNDQESITLEYLLDLATNHPYDFEYANPEQVKHQSKTARNRLQSFESWELGLRALRDRRLAHLDRKMINDPEFLQELAIDINDCDEILQAIEEMLADFHAAYHGERLNFEAIQTAYAESLDEFFN